MKKLKELTINDLKELVDGKKIEVFHIRDKSICKIEIDCNNMVKSIFGNKKVTTILFSNDKGGLDIKIIGDIDAKQNMSLNRLNYVSLLRRNWTMPVH